MLAGLKKKLEGAMSRFAGKTDFLEAVCAACALVASCGGIEDDEVEAAIAAVATNKSLAGAFKESQINKIMDDSLNKTKTRPGRLGLMKELEEVTEEQAEMVYLSAVDVADADGNIDKEEKEMLTKIAKRLGVNEAQLSV